MTLELFLINKLKKKSVVERRKIPTSLVRDALTAYLQPFHGVAGKEIIDIDIPSITTEDVDIKIYWR
jgi:hypothetical protein